jgi:PIN domain nuclease of toxin-antitoxin system
MAAVVHLDTHVVAWLFAGDLQRLPGAVRRLIERSSLAISPMVELELQYLFEIGRTTQPGRVVVYDLADRIGLAVSDNPFPQLVAGAAHLDWTRDPFDRLIVGQPRLARDHVPEDLERLRELVPREVPRELHAEITSSRTKWRRMTFGA